MRIVILSIAAALSLASCGRHNENNFDTNAAEANERPGDKVRRSADTNESAALREGDKGLTTPTQVEKVKKGDEEFAAAATEASLAEVKLGELAAAKTKNEKLNEFALMMIKDHSTANSELKSLADKKGIKIPTECMNCDATFRELHDLHDSEFIARYSEMMVNDHERAVALFKKESENGTDPEMKAWAKEKLPALEHHLAMAKDLQAMSNGSASVKQVPKELSKDSKQSKEQEAPKTKKELRKEKKEARKAKRNG